MKVKDMPLTVNMVIKYENTNEIERVLWIDYFNTYAYLIRIDKDTCKPILRKVDEIIDGLNNNYIKVVKEDSNIKIVNEDEIPEKYKGVRDKSWSVINYIYKEPEIFDSSKRRKLIIEGSKKFNLSERAIYRYLFRYWQGGLCKNSLLPKYYKCGGKGKEKKSSLTKMGRPTKYGENIGINVDEDIKKIFKIAIEKYYYNNKLNSITTTYELMKKEFFIEDFKIENGIKIPVLKDNTHIPTIGQFRYWFQKERNIKKEISSRKSLKKYQLQNRPLLGESTSEAYGPGLFQIDATVGDLYLVSRFNRSWIIGRPIIYVCIDVFSRAIVGIYIGLEGPSWAGAMMALANSAMDKVKFCKEYGMDISENQWPMHYIPESIVADRGEFEGKVAEGLINGLHVKIKNTPSFRADWKGIVEQYFRTTNIKIKPFLPGFINEDFRERGGKDYRLDAKLDLYQFTQIIIKCVLYHNNSHIIKNYDRDKVMIEDNVECIPINLWNWGIKNRSGMLRSYPEEIVKLNLLPIENATVTAKGIKYKGMYYSCELAIKERWFETARNNGSWRLLICYDTRNMNSIYIKNEDNRSYEKCFLLDYQEKYKDKTLEEISHLHYMEKLNEKKLENETSQSKIDLITEIESIVNEANKLKSDGKKESKRSRLKGIKVNRSVEKEINRGREAFSLGNKEEIQESKVVSINNPEINKADDSSNDLINIDLFRKKQKERLDGRE